MCRSGVSYGVCDLAEFRRARDDGLIVPEARGAERGLAELTAIIERAESWRS